MCREETSAASPAAPLSHAAGLFFLYNANIVHPPPPLHPLASLLQASCAHSTLPAAAPAHRWMRLLRLLRRMPQAAGAPAVLPPCAWLWAARRAARRGLVRGACPLSACRVWAAAASLSEARLAGPHRRPPLPAVPCLWQGRLRWVLQLQLRLSWNGCSWTRARLWAMWALQRQHQQQQLGRRRGGRWVEGWAMRKPPCGRLESWLVIWRDEHENLEAVKQSGI